jgi:hypothetical protein
MRRFLSEKEEKDKKSHGGTETRRNIKCKSSGIAAISSISNTVGLFEEKHQSRRERGDAEAQRKADELVVSPRAIGFWDSFPLS